MSRYDYELVAPGCPKSQARHRTYTKGKGGRALPFPINVDPSKRDKEDLLRIVRTAAPDKPLDCPLEMKLVFYFPYLKSHYGTGKNSGVLKGSAPVWHTVRPDCDNLAKLVMDALSGVFYKDDTVICKLEVLKQYSMSPRTEIYIRRLEHSTEVLNLEQG